MDFPSQCVRKKSKTISVTEEFIEALRQTCNWKKAEYLPDDAFYELYIDSDIISSMDTPDSQIIWGRRGTGKTHLLKAFAQKINADPECNNLAYYISCDKISLDSPLEIDGITDEEKTKRYARNTFICFLTNLVEQMIDNYESLLLNKTFYRNFDSDTKLIIKQDVDKQLCNLLENCNYGTPIVVEKEQVIIESDKKEENKESNSSTDIEGQIGLPHKIIASIKGVFNHKKNKSTQKKNTDEIKTTKVFKFSFLETRKVLDDLLTALNIDVLYICIDELWLINQKRELSLQPLFLDYLRQVFLSQSRIALKIASIREVTKLNSKLTATNNVGLQSGHEIFELTNLDTRYITKKARINHYSDILYKRINYFVNRNKDEKKDPYERQYIIDAVFKNQSNLDSMINLTHIIPRNFLWYYKDHW